MYNFKNAFRDGFCSKQDKLPKLYKKPGMSKICSYLPYFVVIITCDDGKCV